MKKISSILIIVLLFSIALSTPITAVKILNLNDNNPPNPPVVNAPESHPVKRWFKIYCTVTDPDGDKIYFKSKLKTSIGWIEISDWLGPYPSGEEHRSSIRSSVAQEMTIGYQAKDIHGAESEWTYVNITFTKSKEYTGSLLILSFLKDLFPRLSYLF